MSVAAIGVDAGSTTWKGVAIDRDGGIVARLVEPAHPLVERQSEEGLARLLEESGAMPETPVGATGYGRKRIRAVRALTEITCHARGAFHAAGRAGLLIDIGGQDTKVIRIGPSGEVLDFEMNDKCAAGTGRFLEVILGRLHVPLDRIGEVAGQASGPVSISSTCTVFAESEVISLVAQGQPVSGIVAGLHAALSSRIAAMAGPAARDTTEILMSGGVALNRAMVEALAARFGRPVTVLPEPQLIGALGAALSVV